MKTAVYIEDGTVQLVLTPETEFEKNALSSFIEKPLKVELFAGSFYDCRGGWIRQNSYYQSSSMYGSGDSNDKSLILRIDEDNPNATPNKPNLRELESSAAIEGSEPTN